MSTRPNRETAYRVFAAEFDDATLSYAESDEERAPNYVVTPTGARVNRLFVVGVLTEVESVNEEQLRARVVDPTGAFVVYAGQYQPEALSFLERVEVPAFVAVTGKARTFQPEDSTRVYTSVRPETLSEVDASTRDRWTVRTAERTVERVETMAAAYERSEQGDALERALREEGVEAGLAAGIPLAFSHYDTTPPYLDAVRELALDATRVVAGEREEVPSLSVTPGQGASSDTGTTADSSTEAETETERTESVRTSATTTADEETTNEQDTVPGEETERAVAAEADTEAAETDASAVEASVDSTGEGSETDSREPDSTDVSAADPAGDDAVSDDGESASFDEADEQRDVQAAETSGTEPTVGEGAVSEDAVSGDEDEFDPEEFELDEEERERIEAEYGTEFESAADVDGPGEAGIETPDIPDADADAESETSEESGPEGQATDTDTPTDSGGGAEPETNESVEPFGDDGAAEAVADDESRTAATGAGASGGDGESDVEATEPAEGDGTDEPLEPDEEAASEGNTDADDTGEASEPVDAETAVVAAMRELDDGDGAEREAVIATVADEYGLTRADAEEGVQSALMSGECYEPDDDTLKPI